MPAALCVVMLTSACAGAEPGPPAASVGAPVVARVLASREMAVVASRSSIDVNFSTRQAYRIAPRDAPGTSFVALATSDDCPGPADPQRLYEMTFVRRPTAFGITNAVDEQWTTDLEIASCRPFAGSE